MERSSHIDQGQHLVDVDLANSLSQPDRVFTFAQSLAGKSVHDIRNVLVNDFEGLTVDAQKDLALCVRSRNDEEELDLLRWLHIECDDFVFDSYGTFLIPPLGLAGIDPLKDVAKRDGFTYIVSAPDWKEALSQLKERKFGHATILLPELITITSSPQKYVSDKKEESAIRVQSVLSISEENPNATFVVGTPRFVTESEKPYNSAYIIQNGQVIAVATKQFLSSSESNYFNSHSFKENRKATKLRDDNAVLICSDLIGVPVAKRTNWEYLDNNIQTLLVIACWGVPGDKFFSNAPYDANQASNHFLNTQKRVCTNIFGTEPNVKRIIICDRAPTFDDAKKDYHTNKPLSSVRFRRQEEGR